MTFSIFCPHCGTQVEAVDAGFATTTVTVTACDALRSQGVVSYELPKSKALEAEVPAYSLRHSTGLVVFA